MPEFSMRELAEMYDAEKGECFMEEAIDFCPLCGRALYKGDTAHQHGDMFFCDKCFTLVEMR